MALLAALADLGGVWPLDEVTGALTRLADRAVQSCITALVADEIRRDRLPGAAPTMPRRAGGMVVLAMGKMGAGELNYSSDIDLICLFDDDALSRVQWPEARAAFIRVTRTMTAILSDVTRDGYVFRTDLRLRPDAASRPSACRCPRPRPITRRRAAPGNARPTSRRGPARATLRRASGS